MKLAILSLASFTLVLASARPSAAQRTGFAVDRFEPAERGSQFFVNETLDLRGSGRPALGPVLDYGYKPLVVYNLDGSERAAIVRHQLFTHLGGSVALFDRLRLGANLPIAAYQDGGPSAVDTGSGTEAFKPADKPAIGDA